MNLPERQHKLAALQGCQITGSLYMSSNDNQETNFAASASTGDDNTFIAPSAPVYWPIEDGPFVYIPDPLAAH